ncbi:DUF3750 domain-containing protein [Limoniibacter endophyticus]|uniref:DUF3750 domain-containing protein n=1 Tax=Limoniibacter endophyticus TaxID=1565040 RepID=A0A8J3DFH9_9HYPH|nr:DUF3750 domain-containing protein [Limoniibacter endophyticus]GHC66359.1 hypothetical protein GCM10010136_09380 [Limoniibacter endophyticus]
MSLKRLLLYLLVFILMIFIVPALVTLAWWELQDRPRSWRAADWSSARLLPEASSGQEPAVYIMAARTGGLKGAFAVHSWIVLKRESANSYERYDKVGWGSPIRRSAYAADGRWYSNLPQIVCEAHGDDAIRIMPAIDAAIENYPYAHTGDYTIWPGPNSNTFIAHITHEVPELGACMAPNATGRDFAPGFAALDISRNGWNLHATLGGLAGFAIGRDVGFELHFMGLVAGFDLMRPAIKVPAYGLVGMPFTRTAQAKH